MIGIGEVETCSPCYSYSAGSDEGRLGGTSYVLTTDHKALSRGVWKEYTLYEKGVLWGFEERAYLLYVLLEVKIRFARGSTFPTTRTLILMTVV